MVKQVIVWNNSLRNKNGQKVRAGKFAAQISHASMAFLLNGADFARTKEESIRFCNCSMTNSVEMKEWIETGYIKIVCKVNSEEELLGIYELAKATGLEAHIITDAGHTEFDKPTITCVGIGPNYSEDIDYVTSHLELM